MSLLGDLLKARQESGLQNLQAKHHVSGQQSPTGQVIGGRAGNPAVAAVPHAHPGKAGQPASSHGIGTVKRGSKLTSHQHVQRVTTHTWSKE